MKKYKLGFIGSGKMATAIAAGVVNNNIYSADEIIASDISEDSLKEFSDKCGAITSTDNNLVTEQSETVILAVKPQVAQAVCKDLNLDDTTHIISIAAGLKVSTLQEWLKTEKVTRVMPNTPLMVGLGASAYCSSDSVTDSEKQEVENIFGSAGIIYKVEEADIDTVTGVSGSGPAYVFEFIQSLTEAGIENGLSEEASLELAVQTVAGAAEMVKHKMLSLIHI